MNPHRKGNTFPIAGVPGDPRLLDQLHRQQTRGPNMGIIHTPSGQLITPKATARARTAALPLTIVKAPTALFVKIVPGYINTQMPTLGGTDLDDATPPTYEITQDSYFYAKVVGTFGSPDTYVITIHTETTATPPTEAISGTGFTSYFYIGYVAFVSGPPDSMTIINDHSGGNLGIESFGSINLWWKK